MSDNPVRVLVWDEAPTHAPKSVYPSSINGAIAAGLNELSKGAITATTANLEDPEQGITEEALKGADVLIWWGHARHDELADEKADMIKTAVHAGLSFIALHSAHYSKPCRKVLDCTGHLFGG